MKRKPNEYHVNNMLMEMLKEEIDWFRINDNLREKHYNERNDKGTDRLAQEKNGFDKDKNRTDSGNDINSVETLYAEIEELMTDNKSIQEKLEKVVKESIKVEDWLHTRIDDLKNGVRDIANEVSNKKDEAKIL